MIELVALSEKFLFFNLEQYRMSTVPWFPGNILGFEKAYLENPWINFGTFSGRFKCLDSSEKFCCCCCTS